MQNPDEVESDSEETLNSNQIRTFEKRRESFSDKNQMISNPPQSSSCSVNEHVNILELKNMLINKNNM